MGTEGQPVDKAVDTRLEKPIGAVEDLWISYSLSVPRFERDRSCRVRPRTGNTTAAEQA